MVRETVAQRAFCMTSDFNMFKEYEELQETMLRVCNK